MSRARTTPQDDPGVAEPVAKGFLRAWLAAKLAPIVVRLAAWGAWLGALLAYGAFVAWKVRRLAKRGALDEPAPDGPPTPISAQEHGVLAWVRGDETFGSEAPRADERA